MIYYVGIGINFFILLLLVTKNNKTIADRILAVWLLTIGLHTIFYVLNLQPVTTDNIHLIMATASPFPLVHGPFLYLYTAAYTNMLPKKKFVWFLHFIPFAVTVLYLLPIYLSSAEHKLAIYNGSGERYLTANLILLILIQASGLFYVCWSFILLRRHKKNIGEQFSYEERINLNWLRYLIYGILIIWIIIIVLKKSSLIFSAGAVFVTILGFLGIRQVGIFAPEQPAEYAEPIQPDVFSKQEQVAVNSSNLIAQDGITVAVSGKKHGVFPADGIKKKYASSGITPQMANAIQKRMSEMMETEKLYTEPELSLAMLAENLQIHPNYLSQVINEKEQMSFFDYINKLRVEEFKRLVALPANSKYTLMSLALDCGFNSKSSFNKNFKKVTGLSPTEYIAVIKKKEETDLGNQLS